MARAMREAVARRADPSGQPLAVRIGIDTGPVAAGVIGTAKVSDDLWGGTVNTAQPEGVPRGARLHPGHRAGLRAAAGRLPVPAAGTDPGPSMGELVTDLLVGSSTEQRRSAGPRLGAGFPGASREADPPRSLAALKARYDPDNTFHLNHNIQPARP